MSTVETNVDAITALIDKAREHSGIPSDNQIAERFGITRQVVSQWRSGKSVPSDERILALSRMAGAAPGPFLVAAAAARSHGEAARAWSALARQLGAAAVVTLMLAPVAAEVVGRDGFEPSTNGLKVRCSTD